MKRLMFLLLAVALLSSVGAFAQSGNDEPLKGDVNGDDVVDVADVVAVLQIMKEGEGIGERQYYVSIGTTPVTASNYKIVNNATQVVASSYENQYEFTPEGTEFVYVLVANNYRVSTITDQSSNTPVDFSIVTDVEISGYKVYKTDNKVSGKILVSIELVKYYWYVGKDETLLGKNGTSYNLQLSNLPTVSSIDDIYSDSQYVGAEENNIYVVCPTEWVGHFELIGLGGFSIPLIDKTSQIVSDVTGYSILRGTGKIGATTIKVIRN